VRVFFLIFVRPSKIYLRHLQCPAPVLKLYKIVLFGGKMCHILLSFFFLLFANSVISAPQNNPKNSVKTALESIFSAIESNKIITSNPLHSYNFEKYASKSYLYFYRAQAYGLIAKNSPNKLLNLNKAIDDLSRAKSSLNFNKEALDELFTKLLKEKIEAALIQKNHQNIIDTIEQLSAKDQKDPRYVLYYGQALFNLSRHEDFKRLARNYLSVFKDEKTIKNYLPLPPRWTALIASIPEPLEISSASSKPALKYSPEMLLSDPAQALGYLQKNVYFSKKKEIFDPASNLYFSLYKKENLSTLEKKFLRTFHEKMYKFAPSFLDSLIFSHWKRADLKIAESLSRAFLSQFEGHPLIPKILYNLGRIQEDSQDYKDATKTFKQVIAMTDDATYLELAQFRLGWMLYLDKREKEAKPYFEEYLKNYPEGRYASTSEYCVIKINSRDNRNEETMQNYIKKYPFSIYAFVLVNEFNLSDTTIRKTLSAENNLKEMKNQFKDFKADIKTLKQLNLYNELADLGLKDDAIKVLKSVSSDPNNEFLSLYLAAQFQILKDTHGEVSNLVKLSSRESPLREYIPWTSLFPAYRKESIETELATQKSEVSPFLILSLIRQESAFNPRAQSSANARGLMQLTLGTANQAAKNLQLKTYTLFKEEDNLKLGIHTFNALLKKYNNRLDYALSAYNAGPVPTDLWIKLRGHLEPLAWIESIPYPETRIYIKSILRNYAVYQMLYTDKAANETIGFKLTSSVP
jgi:tetratricopeptide (TPR) repeat protein